jgi:hypothetical protein
MDGFLLMGNDARERIVESIRQQVKIRPGDEKRWEVDELPLVRRMCAALIVKFKEDGTVNISSGDPTLEHVFLSCTRGTSWFSSVDMVKAVAEGVVPKTGAVVRT